MRPAKTAKIMPRAFSNAFSWMKIIIFIFNFQWKVCSWGSNWQLIIRWLLGIEQATSHYLNQFDRDACCGTKLQQVNNKHITIIINKSMHQISHEKLWLINIHILNGTMKQSCIKIRNVSTDGFCLNEVFDVVVILLIDDKWQPHGSSVCSWGCWLKHNLLSKFVFLNVYYQLTRT